MEGAVPPPVLISQPIDSPSDYFLGKTWSETGHVPLCVIWSIPDIGNVSSAVQVVFQIKPICHTFLWYPVEQKNNVLKIISIRTPM